MRQDFIDPRAQTAQKQQDIPISLALIISLPILVLFLFLSTPAKTTLEMQNLILFSDQNRRVLLTVGLCTLFDLVWLSNMIRRVLGFRRQGAKLSRLAQNNKAVVRKQWAWSSLRWALLLIPIGILAFFLAIRYLRLQQLSLLPVELDSEAWAAYSTSALAATGLGLVLVFSRIYSKILPFRFSRTKLPPVPPVVDGIVLGAIHEAENNGSQTHRVATRLPWPSWITMGLKGLTGNLFIAGVIGSGKSQILLRILKQILTNFRERPALLAIDPKRTFVLELRRAIETLKMSEHLLWVSLSPTDGAVRFNPIWREKMLKNSSFTTVANTLKLASINFLGSSGESRFWEQSSFNLLKAALIYCAVKYDYFTFKELYRALIQARDEGLAAELVDCLSNPDKAWDQEETANIEMAISYFKDEFAQMDQKIRTSILATATSFLNEFLEFRVSRILSPKKEEITLRSLSEAIQQGKLICLNIENDALARSIGTLFKLLYQEAILDRVTDPDHASARYAVLVMDEFQDVVTSGGGAGLGDDRFLAKARESKAITIAATQSVSSLENAIRSEPATRELLQNFRSRIFSNTTDSRTIRLFQEPYGTEEKERRSHSFSENSQDARFDLLFGGFDSDRSNISESISTQVSQEYSITAREFSRLRAFEAFAQIFDGLETRFEKLYLKPYFLKDMRTPHSAILDQLRESATTPRPLAKAKLLLIPVLLTGILSPRANADVLFPNICSVAKTKEFLSCLDFSVAPCVCGLPIPRPCAQISYHIPQTFIEVWPNTKDSYFSLVPGALAQLKAHAITSPLPFGVDDSQSSYSFQARAIPVPFGFPTLTPLPCGEARLDKPCFDLMSEDLGTHWSTGAADSLQPQFLAWSLAPQACMLVGTATGLAGAEPIPSFGLDSGGCSYPLGALPKFPPSPREACNGWGTFYPRSGVYEGGSSSIAALMIAARLKSLGVEVSHTIPGGPGETWQMISPQSSSCFKEGTNPGILEITKGLQETGRLKGKPNGYLFVVWKKVSCCRDIPLIASTLAEITALSAACTIVPGGGI